MPHSRRSSTTIAILGGNTASGSALALLLRNVGYVTWNLDAPLRGRIRESLEGIDLLLITPDLSAAHCEDSLAVLRADRELVSMPILKLSSGSEEEPLSGTGEGGIVPWPNSIQKLTQEIEAVLASVPSDEARESV